MADRGYTLTNVKEAEDFAASRGMGGKIESRMLRSHMDSEELGVSYFRYAPGFRAPFGHHHRTQEEAYVVIAGSGRAKLGDDVVDIKQWDVLRVAPEVVRAFEGGPDGLEMVVVGGRRPAEGDGEMISDWWND